MGTLVGSPVPLTRLVLLPAKDADLIDEVIAGAMTRDDYSSSRRGAGAPASAYDDKLEYRKSENAVAILSDSVSTSYSHLWHFLDSLGKTLAQPSATDVTLRGLLLFHNFLRSSDRGTFQEVVKMLLSTRNDSQGASASSSGKPQLDLLGISQNYHPRFTSGTPSAANSAATAGAKAYAKFLLQRLASSRFVFLAVGGDVTLDAKERQEAAADAIQQLGPRYWTQLDAADLMRQVQALQRLQEGVVACGTTCVQWLQHDCSNNSSTTGAVMSSTNARSPPGTCAGTHGASPAMVQPAPPSSLARSESFIMGCNGPASNVGPTPNGAQAGRAAGAGTDSEAVTTRAVMRVVLETLLKDSFALFSAINYGLMELIERLGRIPKEEGMQAIQVCRTSASQGTALSELYAALGALNIGHRVEFPSVEVMGDQYISSLQTFVDHPGQQPVTPRLGQSVSPFNPHTQALAQQPQQQATPEVPSVPSYVQLAAQQQLEATTQALFGRYAPKPAVPLPAYPALPAPAVPGPAAPAPAPPGQIVPYAPSPVKAAWEVALDSAVASGAGTHAPHHSAQPAANGTSFLAMPPQTSFAGGFDQPLVDSLYEAAEAQRRASEAAASAHSKGNYPLYTNQGQDPFAGSAAIEPPSYVQMSMRAQQQLALELQRKMRSKHAEFAASLHHGQVQPSAWNTYGLGVQYGSVLVPY